MCHLHTMFGVKWCVGYYKSKLQYRLPELFTISPYCKRCERKEGERERESVRVRWKNIRRIAHKKRLSILTTQHTQREREKKILNLRKANHVNAKIRLHEKGCILNIYIYTLIDACQSLDMKNCQPGNSFHG